MGKLVVGGLMVPCLDVHLVHGASVLPVEWQGTWLGVPERHGRLERLQFCCLYNFVRLGHLIGWLGLKRAGLQVLLMVQVSGGRLNSGRVWGPRY